MGFNGKVVWGDYSHIHTLHKSSRSLVKVRIHPNKVVGEIYSTSVLNGRFCLMTTRAFLSDNFKDDPVLHVSVRWDLFSPIH